MKERPIIFSGADVRAILEGRKAQTRRVVKNSKEFTEWGADVSEAYAVDASINSAEFAFLVAGDHGYTDAVPCPYGQPGDRLYVKEAIEGIFGCDARYVADYTRIVDSHPEGWDVWKDFRNLPLRFIPPHFMPRWASRITLENTGVSVVQAEADGFDDSGKPYKAGDWLWNIEFRRVEK